MAFTRAEAFAPASMGNVGIGFDILGLAFQEPGDIVEVELCDQPGAVMHSIEGDGGILPLDANKNTASVAANAYLRQIGAKQGVSIRLCKQLPLGSGMGSSAASAVAAVVATNALFGSPLSRQELLSACMEGEALVSGYHADNVAPCLLGGITLICGTEAAQIYQLPIPGNLHLALVTANVSVPTSQARAVLPTTIPLKAMVAQTAGVACLIDALYRGDVKQMAAAMELDGVVEPARTHLIPMLKEIRTAAKAAGALSVVISGAGPTLCAVCDDAEVAKEVAQVMELVYKQAQLACVARCTQVDREGAQVLSLHE
ncbi:MAG: homoserine kinase [Anaerolineae bacterium]|nr:homoserine kinase [Anaerolineae bacterium]